MDPNSDFDRDLDIACDPNTPPNILVSLVNHEDPWVRWSVAQNPNTPIEVLNNFADENNVIMLSRLARNPAITVDILIKLAQSDHWTVRHFVTKHPNCPEAVKLWLGLDGLHMGYADMSLADFMASMNNE